MFETTEQNNSVSAGRWWASLVLSIAVHACVITSLVVVPLLFFRVLPEGDLLTFLIAPPPPPAPLPPAPPRPVSPSSSRRNIVVSQGDFTPTQIPATIPPPADEPVFSAIGVIGDALASGVGPTGPAGAGGFGIGPPIPAPTPLPPPPRPPKREPLRISSGVQESKLIRRVEPVYPELARRARVSDVVILQISVDEEGSVSEVKVLRGHPLLVEEAVRAVKQWKYSPTLLNGEPVPVTATVTVIFTLR